LYLLSISCDHGLSKKASCPYNLAVSMVAAN
jgi:hypothetical protein